MDCPFCKRTVAPWWKTVHHPGCPFFPEPADGAYAPAEENNVHVWRISSRLPGTEVPSFWLDDGAA